MNEFDRQVAALIRKDYPAAAGLTRGAFMEHLDPLRPAAKDLPEPNGKRVPFVIVVKRDVVATDTAIGLVERRERQGFSVLAPDDLERFEPIDTVSLPGNLAYLLTDVDTGAATLDVTPDDALAQIQAGNRSPLTIDEGVALITHRPEAVAKNAGFSLLGSRCGDRRVTALWISDGRPKLGWCWAGNPHTWLGSASCRTRIGVDAT
jgi:hypothetical protein